MDIKKLKVELDALKEKYNIPSYSVTLFKDGECTNLSGGYRDIEKKLPADSDTIYAIASCTKSFVAGTICSLVDKGLLSLDDCIKDHIPEFEMYDSYVSNNLTVRDILCHRSGLQRHDLSCYSRLNVMTDEDIVKVLRYLKPKHQLRYKWQYSNHMYVLAGYLISRVTGEKWQDVMQKNILEPLGITRVAFSAKEAVALGGCATAYLPNIETKENFVTPYADMASSAAAAGLFMSSADLAKWNFMLLNGGKHNEKQIISKEMCKEMITPQMLINEGTIEPLQGLINNKAYGLGLGTAIFDGHRIVSHSGHIDGFMSYQFFLPDDGIACSILTNLGIINVAQIMHLIVLEHSFAGKKDWGSIMYDFYMKEFLKMRGAVDKLMDEKPENAPCPVELKDICGHYTNPGYDDIEITVDGENLIMNMGIFKFVTVHYANQYFYFDFPHLYPGKHFEFELDIDPQANILGFGAGFDHETDEKIYFTRKKIS